MPRRDTRRLGGLVFAAIGCMLWVAPATGATQVGTNFAANNANGNCGDVYTVLQTQSPNDSYAAPADGVITSWTFQSDTLASAPLWTLKLIVARAAGGDQYTTVGKSPVQSPVVNVPNTYTVRIPVRAGDVLGYFSVAATDPTWCGRGPQAGFEARGAPNEPDLDSTRSYLSPHPGQLNISATLEPDCDSDGFGDETQDPEIPPTAACDPNAPDTSITKQPKDKTKKKTATFEFSSSEPGSTFECSIDGGAFAACSSPDTLKVKKGRHSFEVRAKDAAGNVDASPATDDWKVRKRRKH